MKMDKDLDLSSDWNSSIKKFKVSVVGDMAVGKTCLALRFVKGLFNEEHKATISDIETKAVVINKERLVFQIWDTAGQERFRSLLPLYMKGINGAIIVYDVTDRNSFDHVMDWLADVRKHSDDDTVILLVGNKLDLVKDEVMPRAVHENEAEGKAEENNIFFMEASAKTAENVNDVFIKLGEEMLKRGVESHSPHVYKGIRTSNVPEQRKGRCCR